MKTGKKQRSQWQQEDTQIPGLSTQVLVGSLTPCTHIPKRQKLGDEGIRIGKELRRELSRGKAGQVKGYQQTKKTAAGLCLPKPYVNCPFGPWYYRNAWSAPSEKLLNKSSSRGHIKSLKFSVQLGQ
jgi:hypothetical protein